nr:polyprenol monophosphomannose synthase [Candidatus Sigynarchaeota archaeon]
MLPTYNERENIITLIPELEKILDALLDYESFLMIVDDNSKDGTGDIAVRFAREYKNIVVIRRPEKLGLGSAYRIGFKHAIAIGAEIIFMMDSDLSHRPTYIPNFLTCIKKCGAGLVIGSRYCKDGSTNGWPLKRKMMSFGANFIARILLGMGHVHDTTSGFRAFRTDTLEKIDYNTVISNGYSFLGELLFRVKQQKIPVKEIPIIFYEREHGSSKLGKNEIKGFLMFATRAFFHRLTKLFHL